jgi:hypothetical protein
VNPFGTLIGYQLMATELHEIPFIAIFGTAQAPRAIVADREHAHCALLDTLQRSSSAGRDVISRPSNGFQVFAQTLFPTDYREKLVELHSLTCLKDEFGIDRISDTLIIDVLY